MCFWPGPQSPKLVHETHKKGVSALRLLAGTIEKEILSKIAKLIEYMPGIAGCSLVVMKESLPEIKPNAERERFRILLISFENPHLEIQKVGCLQMNLTSSQTNWFHYIIKPIWVMFLSLASEKACPLHPHQLVVVVLAQRGGMIFSKCWVPVRGIFRPRI